MKISDTVRCKDTSFTGYLVKGKEYKITHQEHRKGVPMIQVKELPNQWWRECRFEEITPAATDSIGQMLEGASLVAWNQKKDQYPHRCVTIGTTKPDPRMITGFGAVLSLPTAGGNRVWAFESITARNQFILTHSGFVA